MKYVIPFGSSVDISNMTVEEYNDANTHLQLEHKKVITEFDVTFTIRDLHCSYGDSKVLAFKLPQECEPFKYLYVYEKYVSIIK